MIKLIKGDCKNAIKDLKENSINAIITDPPYEIGFMGKKWDNTGIANDVELWKECLRVLKPGGYLLSFSATRTYHRMTCSIEDAGFEIRDMIEWVYGSGFPKSLNIGKAVDKAAGDSQSTTYEPNYKNNNFGKGMGGGKTDTTAKPNTDEAKQWEGWGTALKPAHEPICMARKPLSEKTVVKNVLKWGTGGINIDGSRVGTETIINRPAGNKEGGNSLNMSKMGMPQDAKNTVSKGRFPANLIHDGSEEVRSCFPESTLNSNASRFFKSIIYQPKASKSERNKGLENSLWLHNLELITDVCIFTVENLFVWVKEDQNLNTDFHGEVLHKKGISEATALLVSDKEWSIISCGRNITEIFPKAIRFTTEMGSNQIIELKTSSYYQPLNIKDSIADVIETNKRRGLNLAENAGLINILKLIFTKEKMGFPLGVNLVANRMLPKTSVKEKLKKN